MEEKKKINKIIPVILGIIIVLIIGLIVKQVIVSNNDSQDTITKSEKESIDEILNHYIDVIEENALGKEYDYNAKGIKDNIYELPFDQVSVTLRPESGWFNLEDGVVKDYSFVINGYVVTLKDNEVTYEKGNKEKSVVEVLLGINENEATNLDVNSEEVKKLLNIVGIKSLEETKPYSKLESFFLGLSGEQSISNLNDEEKDKLIGIYALDNNLITEVSEDEYDFCDKQNAGACYGMSIDDANKIAKLFDFNSEDLEKIHSGESKYNGMYSVHYSVPLSYFTRNIKHNIVVKKINDYIIVYDNYDLPEDDELKLESSKGRINYIFRKKGSDYYLDKVIRTNEIPNDTISTKEQAKAIAQRVYEMGYDAIGEGNNIINYGTSYEKTYNNKKVTCELLSFTKLENTFTRNAINHIKNNYAYKFKDDSNYYSCNIAFESTPEKFLSTIFSITDSGKRPLTIVSYNDESIVATGQIVCHETLCVALDEKPFDITFRKENGIWKIDTFN